MKTNAKNSVFTAAALVAVINFSSPVSAEQLPERVQSEAGVSIQTISIPYAAVELSSDQGRAALYGKIRHAAREVCGRTGLRETGSLAISSRNRKCYQEAVDAAISKVSSPQVAAIGG